MASTTIVTRYRYTTDDGKVIGIGRRVKVHDTMILYRVGVYKGNRWIKQYNKKAFADEQEAQHWLDDYADAIGFRIIDNSKVTGWIPPDALICPLCGRRFDKRKGHGRNASLR